MSESAIDRARALVESGTPGPWTHRGHHDSNWIQAGEKGYDDVLAPAPVECSSYCYGGSSQIELSDADAAKLTALVNAGPAILELLEEAEKHHGSDRAPNRNVCTECGWFLPCPTAAARDAMYKALGVAE